MKNKLLVILGPTATGKSDLAVALAKKFDGEVVSADSRQVYKGLDIGSGKITKREMKGVPHHLLDVASPRARYTAARYTKDASRAVQNTLTRGKLPIVAGGTGLYIDALVRGHTFPEVPPNTALRKKLEGKSTASLFGLLKKQDPKRAATIDPNNRRRLIRALEIVEALGKVPQQKKVTPLFDAFFIGLNLPIEKLRAKIRSRLERRIKQGMLGEVRALHAAGLSWKRLDELGLEYRFVSRYLRGLISKQEMFDAIERESVRYAKRQMTWWKRQKDIRWFSPVDSKKIEREVATFLKE